MSTIIYADGRVEESSPANGRDYQLSELQAIVGGYIEILRAPDGRWLFLNERGKLEGLPLNEVATQLMAGRLAWDDYIVGDVVLCTGLEAGEERDTDTDPIDDDDGPFSLH